MADYRKWLIAFAALALLVGLAGSASAQTGLQNPAFVCNANAGVPPIVRAEGITELVGDLILNCTGGKGTQAGQQVPLSNVTIFLNTNVTSRLVGSGNLSEATLMIDEPRPTAATAVPDNTVVLPPVGSPPQVLCTPQGSACPIVGDGFGTPYQTIPGTPTVFTGRQSGASSVVWLGVPIDAPGTSGTRVIRITNVRGNACQLGTSSTLIPTQIVMFISVNGSQQVTINNPQQTVAFIQPGLIVANTTTQLVQCNNVNPGLVAAGNFIGGSNFRISVTEGFASSFKRRNIALTSDGVTSPGVRAQNVPGYPYNTESGFYNPSLFTGTPIVGLADFGTRIRLQFNNVGVGSSIFVPVIVPLVLAPSTSSVLTAATSPQQPPSPVASGFGRGQLVLVATDQYGNSAPGFTAVAAGPNSATLAQVTQNGTTAYAVYEVVNSDVNAIERANINVSVAFISNTSQNLPGTGQSTANVGFAPAGGPLASIQTADTNAPIPRFCDNSSPRNTFSINPCTCNLLFPFVTNQAGFDTGIAIANTSLDPFGTSTQSGPVTLYYYGNTTGGGAAPATQKSQTVPAGTELIFTLSNGGNFGVNATPGFQGYIISTANFQYCHAFAFISDAGAQRLAEGYLAIQLDDPFNLNGVPSRTGVLGENDGH